MFQRSHHPYGSAEDVIQGTFSFTALDGPDGEHVQVREGQFNLPLCDTYDDPGCFALVPSVAFRLSSSSS